MDRRRLDTATSPIRLLGLIVGVCLAACTPTPVGGAPPTPTDEAVTLVLLPARTGSDVCCRVVTDNPGEQALTVVCHLIVSDLQGRVVYAGLVPGPPPGHRRSSGFLAPPGRHAQGLFDLPVDLHRVRYHAICPVAAWHGAPPI